MGIFDINKYDIRKRAYDGKHVIWARKRYVHGDGKLPDTFNGIPIVVVNSHHEAVEFLEKAQRHADNYKEVASKYGVPDEIESLVLGDSYV
tara:strand:- start:1723 stop:1995 length:273 start_codon:yes stop_codon:yes gene_type:complete